jgi:NAD(P)-dependent dehydrogenase (short-subunit alcohol dehydrogenase family)
MQLGLIGAGNMASALARGIGQPMLVHDIDAAKAEALASEIGGEGVRCDVGDRLEVERVAGEILERHPQLKLLVNNAGIPGRGDFVDLDPQRIEQVTRVNYLGCVWCLRAFLPGLEAARPSHVVNVASVAGTVAWGAGPYTASKHALVAFSRTTAGSLRSRGIHVHTVNPGFAETEGFPQAEVRRVPILGRFVLSADEVAEKIVAAVEGDRTELFVPAWYRLAAIAQAVAPGTVARLAGRLPGRHRG